ncbi:MAG TPA: Holliday junction resolvase RuvX [Actinomycetota bacterium]|nr:Holliday junction resolvase RuvX [Actinomycetota bacterium]
MPGDADGPGNRSSTGPVLGLDLGDARIGVAISDPDRRLAVPVGTVPVGRPPGELIAIATIARERDVAVVVVGLPITMRGERGTAAAKAEAFAAALRAAVTVPVELHDERLSTVEAERALAAAGTRGRDRRRVVDASAATVILQAWLDAHPRNG